MRAHDGRRSAWPATARSTSIARWRREKPASGSLWALPNHLEFIDRKVADRAAVLLFPCLRRVSTRSANIEVARRPGPRIFASLLDELNRFGIQPCVGFLGFHS